MHRGYLLLIGVFTLICIGWHSCAAGGDTHEPLFRATIEHIEEAGFPDLHMYFGKIKTGCDGLDAERWAHQPNPGKQNTGSPEALWEGKNPIEADEGVLPLYKKRKFKKAYYRIGNILHLVQDMAVPAHAINIPHYSNALEKARWLWPKLDEEASTFGGKFFGKYVDDFECYAARNLHLILEGPIIPEDLGKEYKKAYSKIQKETKDVVDKNSPPAPSKIKKPVWLLVAEYLKRRFPKYRVFLYFKEIRFEPEDDGFKTIIIIRTVPLSMAKRLWGAPHKWQECWRRTTEYKLDGVSFNGMYGYRKFPPDSKLVKEPSSRVILFDPRTGKLIVTPWIDDEVLWSYPQHWRLVCHRYTAAVKWGKAFLEAASRALPPLIDVDDDVTRATFIGNNTIRVYFKVYLLENRKRRVSLVVLCEGEEKHRSDSIILPKGEDLPWEGEYPEDIESLSFDYEFEGEMIPSELRLEFVITDKDNNTTSVKKVVKVR